MPHHIEWQTPQKVILVQLSGQVTLESSAAFDADLKPYLDEGTAPTHVIIDFSAAEMTALNPQKVKEGQTFMQHPNLGWGIIVGANALIRFMTSILFQMVQTKARLFDTREEGIAFLYENDPALSTVPFPRQADSA